MRAFTCTVSGDNEPRQESTLILVDDLERAQELARRQLDNSARYHRLELRENGQLVYTEERSKPPPLVVKSHGSPLVAHARRLASRVLAHVHATNLARIFG